MQSSVCVQACSKSAEVKKKANNQLVHDAYLCSHVARDRWVGGGSNAMKIFQVNTRNAEYERVGSFSRACASLMTEASPVLL